jgi:hypothetical protein
VAEYFEVRIKDNNVKSMCCPEENCTSEAMPGQVGDFIVYGKVLGCTHFRFHLGLC